MSDKDESSSQTIGMDGHPTEDNNLTTSQDVTTEEGSQINLDIDVDEKNEETVGNDHSHQS